MDTTGTFEMARELAKHRMSVALHKYYDSAEYVRFFSALETKSSAFYSLGIGDGDLEKIPQRYEAGSRCNPLPLH